MFIDQREYKDEWYDGTFDLSRLNKELFDKTIMVTYYHSSGMGGPGSVHLLTEDNEDYEIGLDLFRGDEFHIGKISLLDKEGTFLKDELRYKYLAEDNGYVYRYTFGGMILIKEEYVNLLNNKLRKDISDYLKDKGLAAKHYIYEGTKAYRLYQQEEWEKYEAERERVRIRDEDVEWLPLYSNNKKTEHFRENGYYLLIARQDDEYGIVAEKWSIVYEWKDRCISSDSKIIAYNLFCKRYYGCIEGPLKFREPTSTDKDTENKYTFNDYEVNDYGDFIFAHMTLEEAKKDAMHQLNGNLAYGGFNRENLITKYPSNKVKEMQIYHKYYPYILFLEKRDQIFEIITSFHYGPNRLGGGWIVQELAKELNVDKVIAQKLLKVGLRDLDAESIQFYKDKLSQISYPNEYSSENNKK